MVVKVLMVLASALGVLVEDASTMSTLVMARRITVMARRISTLASANMISTLATAREIMDSTAKNMVQDMASTVSKALLAVASASMSLVSETLLMARRMSTSLIRSTTPLTISPTTCLTRRRRISTIDPLMTLSSQLLMVLTTSTTVIRAAQTISTPDPSASAKLVVLALASRAAMVLILISNTLLVLNTMMMKLASAAVTLIGLSLTSTPNTAQLTPISTKQVSMTTSRLPRARSLRRKDSIHSFLKATSAMTHLVSTTSPTVVDMEADHMLSLSSTARAPSVTSTRTHSIESVVETATEAMEASAVVMPTTVVALRATPRHLSEASVDLADSEKRTSRQKIQT